jgi:hypothetical protein
MLEKGSNLSHATHSSSCNIERQERTFGLFSLLSIDVAWLYSHLADLSSKVFSLHIGKLRQALLSWPVRYFRYFPYTIYQTVRGGMYAQIEEISND